MVISYQVANGNNFFVFAGGHYCLTFAYYVYGTDLGSLSVVLVHQDNTAVTLFTEISSVPQWRSKSLDFDILVDKKVI